MLKIPKKLLQETRTIIKLQLFLTHEVGLKKAFSVEELKYILGALKTKKKRTLTNRAFRVYSGVPLKKISKKEGNMAREKIYTKRKTTYLSKEQYKKFVATCTRIKIGESVYIRKAVVYCLKNNIIKRLNGG
ncbi:MAG: hypothetical protein ABSB18_06355 [Candidatus Omnitrophota bacterium]